MAYFTILIFSCAQVFHTFGTGFSCRSRAVLRIASVWCGVVWSVCICREQVTFEIFYSIIIIVIDFFRLCMCELVCTRSHIAIITFNFSSLFYWFSLLFITIVLLSSHSFVPNVGCWCCALITAWNTIHLFNSLRFSQSFSPAVHANISLISHFDPAISLRARVPLCKVYTSCICVRCPEQIFVRPCHAPFQSHFGKSSLKLFQNLVRKNVYERNNMRYGELPETEIVEHPHPHGVTACTHLRSV